MELAGFPEGRRQGWNVEILNSLLREWNHQSLAGGKKSRRAPVLPQKEGKVVLLLKVPIHSDAISIWHSTSPLQNFGSLGVGFTGLRHFYLSYWCHFISLIVAGLWGPFILHRCWISTAAEVIAFCGGLFSPKTHFCVISLQHTSLPHFLFLAPC